MSRAAVASVFVVFFLAACDRSTNNLQDFIYSGTSTLTITGYNGPGGKIVIPSKINGVPVTAIVENALRF
jgi:hypothetical protein